MADVLLNEAADQQRHAAAAAAAAAANIQERHDDDDDEFMERMGVDHVDESAAPPADIDMGAVVAPQPQLLQELLMASQLPRPPPLHSMDDAYRMQLTAQETKWAQDIKDVIEGFPEIDQLTDFMYCQFALLERDNIEGAVRRALHLQTFREEYGLLDTPQDGARMLQKLIQLFPRHFLSFSFSAQDGSYIFINDFKGFSTSILNTPEKVRTWLCGCYYIVTCLCPDLEAVRQGAIILSECEGFDWTTNIDVPIYRKFWSELVIAYPIRFQKVKHFHSGIFVNLLFSMSKRFLPVSIRSTFEVGCQFEGRLDEVYLTPTIEEANARVLRRLEESLKRRYDNEQQFKLQPASSREDD